MEERKVLTSDTWSGAFYELAIELGPMSDERLVAAASALWQVESLDGPYASHDREPWQQDIVSPALLLSDDQVVHLYGVATLPDGNTVGAGTVAVREGRFGRPAWAPREDKSDWLILYITLEALASIYGFDTVDDATWPMWKTLDVWLASIGRTIYEVVPFAVGLVGEEVDAATDAEKVKGAQFAMLVPNDGGGVDWYPLEEPGGQIIPLPERP